MPDGMRLTYSVNTADSWRKVPVVMHTTHWLQQVQSALRLSAHNNFKLNTLKY